MTSAQSTRWRPGEILARSIGLGLLWGAVLGLGFLVGTAMLLGDFVGVLILGGIWAAVIGGVVGAVLGLACGIAFICCGPAIRRKRTNAPVVASAVCLVMAVSAAAVAVALSHVGVAEFAAFIGVLASLVAALVAPRAAFGARRRRPKDLGMKTP